MFCCSFPYKEVADAVAAWESGIDSFHHYSIYDFMRKEITPDEYVGKVKNSHDLFQLLCEYFRLEEIIEYVLVNRSVSHEVLGMNSRYQVHELQFFKNCVGKILRKLNDIANYRDDKFMENLRNCPYIYKIFKSNRSNPNMVNVFQKLVSMASTSNSVTSYNDVRKSINPLLICGEHSITESFLISYWMEYRGAPESIKCANELHCHIILHHEQYLKELPYKCYIEDGTAVVKLSDERTYMFHNRDADDVYKKYGNI